MVPKVQAEAVTDISDKTVRVRVRSEPGLGRSIKPTLFSSGTYLRMGSKLMITEDGLVSSKHH